MTPTIDNDAQQHFCLLKEQLPQWPDNHRAVQAAIEDMIADEIENGFDIVVFQ